MVVRPEDKLQFGWGQLHVSALLGCASPVVLLIRLSPQPLHHECGEGHQHHAGDYPHSDGQRNCGLLFARGGGRRGRWTTCEGPKHDQKSWIRSHLPEFRNTVCRCLDSKLARTAWIPELPTTPYTPPSRETPEARSAVAAFFLWGIFSLLRFVWASLLSHRFLFDGSPRQDRRVFYIWLGAFFRTCGVGEQTKTTAERTNIRNSAPPSPLTDTDEARGGCAVRVAVQARAYDARGAAAGANVAAATVLAHTATIVRAADLNPCRVTLWALVATCPAGETMELGGVKGKFQRNKDPLPEVVPASSQAWSELNTQSWRTEYIR